MFVSYVLCPCLISCGCVYVCDFSESCFVYLCCVCDSSKCVIKCLFVVFCVLMHAFCLVCVGCVCYVCVFMCVFVCVVCLLLFHGCGSGICCSFVFRVVRVVCPVFSLMFALCWLCFVVCFVNVMSYVVSFV